MKPLNALFNSPLSLNNLTLEHRLIQGPLAGFSCAPFRQLFSFFTKPAYCVSEMLSAYDVIYKHTPNNRYLYRSPNEGKLCYQIAGNDPMLMADAAAKLQELGADLIDINCGCPKPKIRKKGAGSALLEKQQRLIDIIHAVRQAIACPLTVKMRLQGNANDNELAKAIAAAGVDALIVHGRRWCDDYDVACNLSQIASMKREINIPIIANGDMFDNDSVATTFMQTECDAVMIARAGTGKPWLFQELLTEETISLDNMQLLSLFLNHLRSLAALENEYQAVLQSRSLVRYYFRKQISQPFLQEFYQLNCLQDIETNLKTYFALS